MESLISDALATHRLTRLLVDDVIFDRPRRRIDRALHEAGWERAREILRCSWCAGIWVGGAVAVARTVAPRPWGWAARALACADVAGIVASAVVLAE